MSLFFCALEFVYYFVSLEISPVSMYSFTGDECRYVAVTQSEIH